MKLTVRRQQLIGWVVIGWVVVLALLGYLFVSGIVVGGTGDAGLPTWVGATRAGLSFWLLAAAVAALYVAVAVTGTRLSARRWALTWQRGTRFGLALGAGWLVLLGLSNLVTTSQPLAGAEQVLAYLAAAGVMLYGAVVAARESSSIGAAPQTAFWPAVVLAVCFALIELLMATLFGDHLARAAWAGDLGCQILTGAAHRSCVVGDAIGSALTLVVALPLAGAALGAFGGMGGFGFSSRMTPLAGTENMAAMREPMIFAGVLALALLAQTLVRIW
jgi:hypothetical protein